MQILAFGSLVHQINSFQEFLKLEQIFQKNLVTGKTPLFVKGPFVVAILFALTFASDRAGLNRNGVFNLSGFK